jgi:hypothetical protein
MLNGYTNSRRLMLSPRMQPSLQRAVNFWVPSTVLRDAIEAGELVKNETRRLVERPGTEQRLRCKTAFNADSLRGDYADLLILDEYQLMHEGAWEDVGAPMLLDNDGDAVFIYTPPSRRTRHLSRADDPRHASKLYAKAGEDGTGRWATFHFTSRENPYISQAALGELAQDMTANGDACGIMVCGKAANGHGYVLDDASIQGLPAVWAAQAVAAYHRHHADRLVAESNFGGEMVRTTIATVPGAPPVRLVHASRGKLPRAEPIAALYEHRRVHHVGSYPPLEEELRPPCPLWRRGERSKRAGGNGPEVALRHRGIAAGPDHRSPRPDREYRAA